MLSLAKAYHNNTSLSGILMASARSFALLCGRHDGGFVEDKNDVDTVGRADSDNDTPIAQWHRNLQGSSAAPMLPQLSNGSTTKPPFPTVIPKFTPLRLDPSRCTPEGRPNYNALRNKNQHTPLLIFKWFLSDEILSKIAANTNEYARLKGAGGGREWFAVTSQELLCFFGLCLYMGLFRSPRTEDYWDRSGKGPHHTIMSNISLRRFQQIKRYLNICGPSGDNGSSFFFN